MAAVATYLAVRGDSGGHGDSRRASTRCGGSSAIHGHGHAIPGTTAIIDVHDSGADQADRHAAADGDTVADSHGSGACHVNSDDDSDAGVPHSHGHLGPDDSDHHGDTASVDQH
jgi:hypothetical protein